MKTVILAIFLSLIFSIHSKAQDNLQNEMTKYVVSNAHSIQELSTKLVDEYETKHMKFMKLENGRYIPVKANEIKSIEKTQVSSDVILIFAIIGAVLVGLLIIRAL
jgi:hypothetical protein